MTVIVALRNKEENGSKSCAKSRGAQRNSDSLLSCTCKAMRHPVYAVTAEKGTGIAFFSSELSEHQNNPGCSSTARNAYRKKSRSKSKAAKKFTQKVFPEELFDNGCKERLASSFQSSRNNIGNEASSSIDVMNCNYVPTVRPSLTCIHLAKISQTIFQKSTILDSLSSKVSDINSSNLHCLICSASKSCELQPLEYGNGVHHFIECPSLSNDRSVRANSEALPNQDINKARSNLENVRKKDQRPLTWKRSQKLRSTKCKRDTLSLPDHVHPASSSFHSISHVIPQAPAPIDGLSVMPCSSAKQNSAASASKAKDADGDILCRGLQIDVYRESSAQFPEQRLSSELYHLAYRTQPLTNHSAGFDKSLRNRTYFGKTENRIWREIQSQGSKLLGQQYDTPCQTELLQQHFPCEALEDKNLHHFVNENWRNVSCSSSR